MMSRIIAPAQILENAATLHDVKASLHDHTYGITSDPLTQFACVFSALIHDVDHPGIGNPDLAKEDPAKANRYGSRSIAEQHSLDISWELLMESRFSDLRACLFPSREELQRFRELVVNSLMATDIMDKELKAMRNDRWEKAFKTAGENREESKREDVNRKATIVIEHLIQASDVSHTMQHWHVYRKWNANLFREMRLAFKQGRMGGDPASFWYHQPHCVYILS